MSANICLTTKAQEDRFKNEQIPLSSQDVLHTRQNKT